MIYSQNSQQCYLRTSSVGSYQNRYQRCTPHRPDCEEEVIEVSRTEKTGLRIMLVSQHHCVCRRHNIVKADSRITQAQRNHEQ